MSRRAPQRLLGPVLTAQSAPRSNVRSIIISGAAASSTRLQCPQSFVEAGYSNRTAGQFHTNVRCTFLDFGCRTFSSSALRMKKGGKAARESSQSSSNSPKASNSNSNSSGADTDDPFDFSTLESDIEKCIERLKSDLSKLRAGGRFNPEVLEALRVQSHKGSSESVKLGDLAQVIPKGRIVQIMVGEAEHVKPVSSAVQSSNLNLTPQPDPTGANPLLLQLTIPPPTAESRKQAVAQAAKAGETANTGVRNARGTQQKKLRAMQLAKSARPDDLKKAGTQMEKVVEKGAGEVKKIVDGAKRVLDS